MEKLECKEASIFKELKDNLNNLKETYVKLKSPGVKDNIDKLFELFNLLAINRNERVALRKAGGAGTDVARKIDVLRHKLDVSCGEIVKAIKEIPGKQSPTTEQNNEMKEEIIKAISEVKSDLGASTWTEVVKKGRSAKKQEKQEEATEDTKKKSTQLKTKSRPPAIIIDMSREAFPELAKKIRSGINPEIVGEHVTGMRQTKTGSLLFTLKGNPEQVEKIRTEISRSAGPDVTVRTLKQDKVVEIIDIDQWSTSEEIKEAITRETNSEGVRVLSTRNRFGGQRSVLVAMPQEAASKILTNGRLRVGPVSCRVRIAEMKSYCFRCLASGHQSSNCQGTDRTNCCMRCGVEGHFAATCSAEKDLVIEFKKTLDEEQKQRKL